MSRKQNAPKKHSTPISDDSSSMMYSFFLLTNHLGRRRIYMHEEVKRIVNVFKKYREGRMSKETIFNPDSLLVLP